MFANGTKSTLTCSILPHIGTQITPAAHVMYTREGRLGKATEGKNEGGREAREGRLGR